MNPLEQARPARSVETVGRRLQRAREVHGWSLDSLSLRTRIPIRHLETIESGQGHNLPGGFIGKSFVRQYAEAVGMDAEQTLREFIAQSGVNLEVAFEERKVSPFTPESLQRFQSRVWRSAGIGFLALVAVIVLGIYLLRKPASDTQTRENDAASVPAAGSLPPAQTLPQGTSATAATPLPVSSSQPPGRLSPEPVAQQAPARPVAPAQRPATVSPAPASAPTPADDAVSTSPPMSPAEQPSTLSESQTP